MKQNLSTQNISSILKSSMFKHFTFFAIFLGSLCVSCGTKSNSKEAKSDEQKEVVSSETIYTPESLLEKAETLNGDTVTIVANITHTCKFSGRRCFVIGKDPNTTLRIEAKGKIGGFNRELIGSEVKVKGIVRENRLTKEYLNKWEEELKESGHKEDGSAETCAAETNNINSMRAWMKKHNKDYYAIYYMDGLAYEVVE